MVTTEVKVSDVFHMQPNLPRILSCLLICFPFLLHSPQLSLAHIFTPTKLEAAYAATAPEMSILPIARCQTRHGTLPSKCTAGLSSLWLLFCFGFFFMKLVRMYCLWNIHFFWVQAGKPLGRGMAAAEPVGAGSTLTHPAGKQLDSWGSWDFLCFKQCLSIINSYSFYMKNIIFGK